VAVPSAEEFGDLGLDDLAEGVARQLLDDGEACRNLGGGQTLLAPRPQGIAVRWHVEGWHRRQRDALAPLAVVEADDSAVGDVGVGPVDLLDLRADTFSPPVLMMSTDDRPSSR